MFINIRDIIYKDDRVEKIPNGQGIHNTRERE